MDYGLYIHVPFCRTVCPYCEFNVVGWREPPWSLYQQALLNELRAQATAFKNHRLRTLYFGGGTPSLMPIDVVEAILDEVKRVSRIDEIEEISFELNPGTVDRGYLEALKDLGITRVSIGWQATQKKLLHVLGRDHDDEESRLITKWALDCGFRSVSLDLIFAVPGQTLPDLDASIDELIEVGTHHVSMYELTFDEGTPFSRRRDKGQLQELEDDLVVAMMERVSTRLVQAGYERYEVSSFARAGHRSLHNQGYWHGLPYLGVGPGAHGLRQYGDNDWERYQSVVSIKEWLDYWQDENAALQIEWTERLSSDTRYEERALTLVRLGDPFPAVPNFVPRSRLADWERGIEEAIERGWLERVSNQSIRSTSTGLRFADSLGLLLSGM